MLQELGLSPVWKLRSTLDQGLAPAAACDVAGADRSADLAAAEARPVQAPDADRRGHILNMGWAELEQAIKTCVACPLHATRNQAVVGVGDRKADWLFVGEAPGAEEDAKGEPFVGQAGKLLDNMLASIGLNRRKGVYISNVIKCRPPQNRNPHPDEVAQCTPFLERQIQLIQPTLIIAMGKFASSTLVGEERTISSLRGRVHDYGGTPMIVTYHPAYLLRNLPDKAKAWEDLCLARQTMRDLKQGGADTT
jgi:uracil-DNA glycosylase family 4